MTGLGTRSYVRAIGEIAESIGVRKPSVSRHASKASGERLKELGERRLDDRDYVIVYVDERGEKRILGIREVASENAIVALPLLEDLFECGLEPGRARLFVLDGSKALRKAVCQVFGDGPARWDEYKPNVACHVCQVMLGKANTLVCD